MKKLKTKVLAILSAVGILASMASVSASASESGYWEYQTDYFTYNGYSLSVTYTTARDSNLVGNGNLRYFVEGWMDASYGASCTQMYTGWQAVDKLYGSNLGSNSSYSYNSRSVSSSIWYDYTAFSNIGSRIYGSTNIWPSSGGSYVAYTSKTY